jgi:hypothetical protein
MELREAIEALQTFQEKSLKKRIASIESQLRHQDKQELVCSLEELQVTPRLLGAALLVKGLSGQINVMIHALGILTALPRILDQKEKIELLSLGAGSTGRPFDLVTDRRIAEFKFINWRGGPESIRQNSLFKDFFELAEADTDKDRYLYVIGLTHPLKFFAGTRAVNSVLSRNHSLRERFYRLYGDQFSKVCEYFEYRRDRVRIVDIAELVPELGALKALSEQV